LFKMSKDSITITVDKRQRIIDLNKDIKNFILNFQIKEKDNKEFFMQILSQKQLDNENIDDLDMKLIEGSISGTVEHNEDIYENYVLVLKNENDDEIEVEVNLEIDETFPDVENVENIKTGENYNNDKKSNNKYYYILILLVLIILTFVVYNFFTAKPVNVVVDDISAQKINTYEAIKNLTPPNVVENVTANVV